MNSVNHVPHSQTPAVVTAGERLRATKSIPCAECDTPRQNGSSTGAFNPGRKTVVWRICCHLGLTVSQMQAGGKNSDECLARQVITGVLRECLDLSFSKVARETRKRKQSVINQWRSWLNMHEGKKKHWRKVAGVNKIERKTTTPKQQILPSGVPADRPDQDMAASHAGIQPAKSPRRSDRGSGDVGGTIRPGPRRRRAYNHDSGKWETVGI